LEFTNHPACAAAERDLFIEAQPPLLEKGNGAQPSISFRIKVFMRYPPFYIRGTILNRNIPVPGREKKAHRGTINKTHIRQVQRYDGSSGWLFIEQAPDFRQILLCEPAAQMDF